MHYRGLCELVKDAVPLSALIDALGITRRGQSFQCPNAGGHTHGDRHLSGWIAHTGRTWTCWGCHLHGSVIDLLALVHGISQPDATRSLVEYAGLWAPAIADARSRVPQRAAALPRPAAPLPEPPPKPASPDVHRFLLHAQAALLTAAHAREYLHQRGIPLAVARAAGLGFAPRRTWPHARGKGQPRIVAPLTTPDGTLLTLYGRSTVDCPKALRHDVLPGAKGVFHAPALREEGVILVEGVFDALACLAARRPAAALCGLSTRDAWWAQIGASRVILALDGDEAGRQCWRALADAAAHAGKQVHGLTPDCLGDHKDLNEYWVAHQTLPKPLRTPVRSRNASAP
jgi:DNA primase